MAEKRIKNIEEVNEAIKEAAEKIPEITEEVKEAAEKAVNEVTEKVPAAKKAAEKAEKASKKAAATAEKASKKAAATAEKASKKAASTVKKVVPVQETFFEFEGSQIKMEEIVEKVRAAYKAEGHRLSAIRTLRTYVNPYERRAYYVVNDKVEGKYIEF